MLQSLHVKNLALIDEIEVEFAEGLNILTGETGAGKSIILGSVNLALGGRYTKDLIRQGENYALVELVFTVTEKSRLKALEKLCIYPEDGLLILSRKLMDGRSVSRINGETVTIAVLKEVAAILIDIHGQHEHQSLLYKKNHLAILDAFAKEAGEWKKKVADSYREYRRLEKELKEADKDEAERAKEISFLEFEIDEIENAGITAAECQSVEEDYRRMMQGKRIAENLEEAYLYTAGEGGISASEAIGRAVRAAAVAAEHDDKSGELYEQLVEVENLIGDSGRELRGYLDSLSFEPEQFYETESRLNQINHLKVKYGDSAEAILQHKADDEERLLILKNYDEYLNELKGKLKKSEERLQKECEGLSKIRKKEAKLLQAKIAEGLQDLNFLDVCFEIRFSKTSGYTVEGTDEVEFMISMNPGEPTRPLATVASGGELSRIMLAIKAVMADKDEIETLIFDEIDVGISGRTAQKVSEKMCLIGRKHQVICITHLAQIAAMADTHYLIEKRVEDQMTKTKIRQLDGEESVQELGRILGGAKITDAVLENAREMKILASGLKK